MRFLENLKSGCSWLYQKTKIVIIATGKWLKKKFPILGAWILLGCKLAIKLAKGSIFGAYYGIKDGYNAWKQTPGYSPCTCINFEYLENDIIDEIEPEPMIE